MAETITGFTLGCTDWLTYKGIVKSIEIISNFDFEPFYKGNKFELSEIDFPEGIKILIGYDARRRMVYAFRGTTIIKNKYVRGVCVVYQAYTDAPDCIRCDGTMRMFTGTFDTKKDAVDMIENVVFD